MLYYEIKVKGGKQMFQFLRKSGVVILGSIIFFTPGSFREKEEVPLIPRKVFFGNPEKSSPQISPDGKYLAYLAPDEGVLNVWVAPLEDISRARPVTRDRKRGIRIYFWAFTNRHILYLQDKEGDENWRVYSVDVFSEEVKDLTPIENVQARIQEVSHKYPEEILIALNDRNPQLHDIYRINIITGEKKKVLENPGFFSFITDDTYRVRFAMQFTPDGGSEILQPSEAGGWQTFLKIDYEDSLTTWPVGFDKSNEFLYMIDSRGRDTAALEEIHIASREKRVIVEDPRADIDEIVMHPTEKTILAAGFIYERKHWKVVDPASEEIFSSLQQVVDGDFSVISQTLDNQRWIVAYTMDNGPIRYYLYDLKKKEAKFLFTARPSLENLPLAKMHPVIIPSRDGFNLVTYYTLPIWSDPNGDGKPEKPLPLVLTVHGGPWSRDIWGYNPWHQWLANRGYAVLSVNFRASTGFGKKFLNAGNREWGGKMHDDLIDGVLWAIKEGIADPAHIAIMGGSYGGYATLVGMTFTPEVFACGVDIVGPSNLVTFMNSIPPYWKPLFDLLITRVGDPTTEEGREFLLSRSPISYVERIQKPLLIAQGKNDPRVKETESEQIVDVMQKKGIGVTYVLYPDEGHEFARPENSLSFHAITEIFLSQCLGGRYEPIGEDFQGSSLTVPAGAELIPGLTDALKKMNQGSSPSQDKR